MWNTVVPHPQQAAGHSDGLPDEEDLEGVELSRAGFEQPHSHRHHTVKQLRYEDQEEPAVCPKTSMRACEEAGGWRGGGGAIGDGCYGASRREQLWEEAG